jgi:hypothetical protein
MLQRSYPHGSQTRLPHKLFSILQICFFCINLNFPLYLQAFFEVQPPIFDQKILPTVRSVLFPTHAIMPPMNAELLITEHKKEEGTAKHAKYAKNPDPSPKSGFGFACFAYFAVQEIAWAGILVAPVQLCVESSFLSVKSVKSAVQFLWLRQAAPGPLPL